MRLFVNNHHVGRHLSNLPVTQHMWAIIDVYGNTIGVQSVREETVPVQVLARGHDAIQAMIIFKTFPIEIKLGMVQRLINLSEILYKLSLCPGISVSTEPWNTSPVLWQTMCCGPREVN